MKKSTLTIVAASALLAACSGNSRPMATGLSEYADTIPADSTAATPVRADSTATLPPVSSQGIGPIRLGMSPNSLPDTMTGIYDSLSISEEVWDDERFTVAECFLDSVKTLEAMAISDPSRIDALTIVGGRLGIRVGGKSVRIGSPASAISSQEGVHRLPDSPDGSQRYEWHGITVYTASDTVMAISLGESVPI